MKLVNLRKSIYAFLGLFFARSFIVERPVISDTCGIEFGEPYFSNRSLLGAGVNSKILTFIRLLFRTSRIQQLSIENIALISTYFMLNT